MDIFVSDHCALVVKLSSTDWGPKTFRYIDACHTDRGFSDFVKKSWDKHNVEGNEIWSLKEKLKSLKRELRMWNKEIFGHVGSTKETIMLTISELDKKDEELVLDEKERIKRKHLFPN